MSHDHREIEVRALGNAKQCLGWSIVLFFSNLKTIIDEMWKVNANVNETLNEAASCIAVQTMLIFLRTVSGYARYGAEILKGSR